MAGKWSDLIVRSASGAVLAAVGLFAVYSGGVIFSALIGIALMLMLWEVWHYMPKNGSGLGMDVQLISSITILGAAMGLVTLQDLHGTQFMLWLVVLVVITDVAGYFAGRSIGGPKFWPAISPNKTWSGTVAGWIGAAVWGALFVIFMDAPWVLVLQSVVLSFASQMGDIAESALKRRAGVKDSSKLIPGHGGVMDRFDGLMGAAIVAVVLIGTTPV
ncbi:MAG: phosphatidate cytidylyltransferase [Planktomarina sp.]